MEETVPDPSLQRPEHPLQKEKPTGSDLGSSFSLLQLRHKYLHKHQVLREWFKGETHTFELLSFVLGTAYVLKRGSDLVQCTPEWWKLLCLWFKGKAVWTVLTILTFALDILMTSKYYTHCDVLLLVNQLCRQVSTCVLFWVPNSTGGRDHLLNPSSAPSSSAQFPVETFPSCLENIITLLCAATRGSLVWTGPLRFSSLTVQNPVLLQLPPRAGAQFHLHSFIYCCET